MKYTMIKANTYKIITLGEQMKKIFLLLNSLIIVCYFPNLAFAQSSNELSQTASYAFELYKKIHQYPELGKKEFRTSELIKNELKQIGYDKFIEIPGLPTAIITVLDTGKSGSIIGLRSELDARPSKERNGLEYASKIDNVMHSCGHDAHASILLGTAKLAYKLKESLKGKIYFIFQPAEEIAGGADDIVNSGILKEIKLENIFALHVSSGLSVGKVSISSGYIMAGSNYFSLEISGKGSHAATPQEGDNIPLLASKIVEKLTSIPNKINQVERPLVISITHLESKSNALNVIPAKGMIKGTIRAFENVDDNKPSIRELMNQEIQSICTDGVVCELKITKGAPPNYNDPDLFKSVLPKLSAKFSGEIDTTPYKNLFSEDFSYYTTIIPCLYFLLGSAKGNLGFANVHSNEFTVHPDTFIYGIELFMDLLEIDKI